MFKQTKVTNAVDAQSVDQHLLTFVQENVSKGVAAIKDMTGLTISPPSKIDIFTDRAYAGKGFFDEDDPSTININARYAENLSATLYVLYPYLRSNRLFAEEMTADAACPNVLHYSSDPYLFIEIGAADFFAHAVSIYEEHPEDRSKYSLLRDMLDDWSVSDIHSLIDLYTTLSNAPKTPHGAEDLLRGRPDAISEELNIYIDNLILGDKKSLEHITPLKKYDWGWMYSFGRLMFGLMYVMYDFDGREVIRRALHVHE